METYIILGNYARSGQELDLDNMPDMKALIDKALEAVGGKLVCSWATLGRFDYVVVVEVPSATAVRAFLSSAPPGSRTETLQAFPATADPELLSLLRKVLGK